ncbi:PilW family protein [Pleionea sediminis]|uniref:PilW family protein n=1 Tax=Pleionea sediminis TaxID=2569479 RepID=UPI0011847242|nr:PilW family protein [Pleionea sediminis]
MKTQTINFVKVRGFSLVELMVAGILGLILLGGVVSVFVGSKTSYSMQEELANVQTDGRFAITYMERIVQNSGWFGGTAGSTTAINAANTSDDGSDFDRLSTLMSDMTNTLDCNGANVASGDVISSFYVDEGSLMCQGTGGGAQPVISNVVSFQVLYGIDTTNDGVVNQYVNAGSVTDFSKVYAVKIGLLIQTPNNVVDENVVQEYTVLDRTYNFEDRRLRRAFSTTIQIPNQAYGTVRIL